MGISVGDLQWLEKTILASSFKDKLIELGEDKFVKWAEEQCKKSVEQYRSEYDIKLRKEVK